MNHSISGPSSRVLCLVDAPGVNSPVKKLNHFSFYYCKSVSDQTDLIYFCVTFLAPQVMKYYSITEVQPNMCDSLLLSFFSG